MYVENKTLIEFSLCKLQFTLISKNSHLLSNNFTTSIKTSFISQNSQNLTIDRA